MITIDLINLTNEVKAKKTFESILLADILKEKARYYAEHGRLRQGYNYPCKESSYKINYLGQSVNIGMLAREAGKKLDEVITGISHGFTLHKLLCENEDLLEDYVWDYWYQKHTVSLTQLANKSDLTAVEVTNRLKFGLPVEAFDMPIGSENAWAVNVEFGQMYQTFGLSGVDIIGLYTQSKLLEASQVDDKQAAQAMMGQIWQATQQTAPRY